MVDSPKTDIVGLLREFQQVRRLSDDEMGSLCGLSRSMYQKVRLGRVRLGHRSLRPILRAFPTRRVERAVVAYLREEYPRLARDLVDPPAPVSAAS